MSKVTPYHSSNPADPPVHHDHDDCPAGQTIPAANRMDGDGGRRPCEHCRALS
jgi:hypothetical protein